MINVVTIPWCSCQLSYCATTSSTVSYYPPLMDCFNLLSIVCHTVACLCIICPYHLMMMRL